MQDIISLYLLSLAIIFTYAKIIFIISHLRKNHSVADIAYGPTFIFAAIGLIIIQLSKAPLSIYTYILFVLIFIWAVRLSYRLYKRNHGKPEDFRHKEQRERWEKKGKTYANIRSYIQLFLIRGFIISIILLPFTISLASSHEPSVWLFIGLLIWIVGFYFETVGDRELDEFMKTKEKHGKEIIDSGLWKYSRHPNYFGESLMWWAIAVIGISATYSILPIISPLLITSLMLFVTGVPMIEKRFAGNPQWESYKKKTNKFLPFRPKKIV